MAVKIENWYKLSRQQLQQQQQQYQQQQSCYQFNATTKPTLASDTSYAYRPSHDPRNFPHYSLNTNNYNSNNIMPTSPTSIHPTALIGNSSSSSLSQDFSSKLNISINTASSSSNKIQLPSWTNNIFPNSNVTEPLQLAKWITTKENPPSILLIDVRTRDLFKNGCIKHQWIIQIDPNILSQKE